MALKINGHCVNCYACVDVCPTSSIFQAKRHFAIDPRSCTECVGSFAAPQCASICPVECAIVDHEGVPLNPVGSLTGIPPEKMAAAIAEIRAR